MKYELFKETKDTPHGQEATYFIRKDGEYVMGSATNHEQNAKEFLSRLVSGGIETTLQVIDTKEI